MIHLYWEGSLSEYQDGWWAEAIAGKIGVGLGVLRIFVEIRDQRFLLG